MHRDSFLGSYAYKHDGYVWLISFSCSHFARNSWIGSGTGVQKPSIRWKLCVIYICRLIH